MNIAEESAHEVFRNFHDRSHQQQILHSIQIVKLQTYFMFLVFGFKPPWGYLFDQHSLKLEVFE